MAKRIYVIGNTGWNMLRYRAGLLQELSACGWDILAIADFDSAEASQAESLGIPIHRLPIQGSGTNPVQDVLYFVRLLGLYRRTRPHVVHHFTIKPVIFGSIAAKLAGVPVIVNTITGRGRARERWNSPLGRLIRLLYRIALSGNVHTSFQNEEDRAAMLNAGLVRPEMSSVILGSGIDTCSLRPGPEPATEPLFVFVGRMLWSKGVGDFVAAARLVAQVRREAQFLLIGGAQGDYGSRNPDFVPQPWLKEVDREGIVEWLGRLSPEEVEQHMKRARAVVLPSYYGEGCPRTLLEAAALGVAAITVDSAGCRDVVQHQRTGLICPKQSPEQLAEAMIKLLDNPDLARTFGAAARQFAESEFDQRFISAAYQRLYTGG